MTEHNHVTRNKQRLKEAIWRVQSISASLYHAGRMPKYKLRIVDAEMELLAEALGVPPLNQGKGNRNERH